MNLKGEKLKHLVQSKLPHTKVNWDPAPDEHFENSSCTLIAVNSKNPEKKGSINYQDGITEDTVEILANDFVTHIGPEVSD